MFFWLSVFVIHRVCIPDSMLCCCLSVYSSRGSVDRDKKTLSDVAVETYDNVPSENALHTSQNGFISIITSKGCFVIYVCLLKMIIV